MKIIIDTDNTDVKVKKSWKDRNKTPDTIHAEISAAIAYLLAERSVSEFQEFYVDNLKTNWIDWISNEANKMLDEITKRAKVEITTKKEEKENVDLVLY